MVGNGICYVSVYSDLMNEKWPEHIIFKVYPTIKQLNPQ